MAQPRRRKDRKVLRVQRSSFIFPLERPVGAFGEARDQIFLSEARGIQPTLLMAIDKDECGPLSEAPGSNNERRTIDWDPAGNKRKESERRTCGEHG